MPPLVAALAAGGDGDLDPALDAIAKSLKLDISFGFHTGVNQVVATMALWNKVPSTSPTSSIFLASTKG